MAKYSKKAQDKIEKVMHEFKTGELKSGKDGQGGKVKSRKQAIYSPNSVLTTSVVITLKERRRTSCTKR